MSRCALVLVLALAMGGCSLDSDDAGKPRKEAASESGKIRAWSRALNDGDFEQAASFFAEDAVVQQLEEMRLDGPDAAEAFNRSLPCKADVTDVKDEGDTLLVAFRLRDGPGGPCEGAARVRFRFENGKFAEWRQLSAPGAPDGDIANSTYDAAVNVSEGRRGSTLH